MNRDRGWALIVALLMVGAGYAVDTDNDGLADEVEKKLGSDPKVAETFCELGKDADDPGLGEAGQALDLATISCAHVAGERYLWKLTFHGNVDPAGCTALLYVDVDNNPDTGRQDNPAIKGTDMMYALINGKPSEQVRDPGLLAKRKGQARTLIAEQVMYVCDDVPLAAEAKEATCKIRLLSQHKDGGKSDFMDWVVGKVTRNDRTELPAIEK